MATTKEIKNRIKGIQDTQKITNAMYLIASTKMRKAKLELDKTRPFFNALQIEIRRIFRTAEDIENRYFFPKGHDGNTGGPCAMLVITADKGLAGAYNMNVIKKANQVMSEHKDTRIFVIGEYGRQYYITHHIPIEKSFRYTAQNPTPERAREIRDILLKLYQSGEIAEFYVVYTDMTGGMTAEAKASLLLPFHRAQFTGTEEDLTDDTEYEFMPSPEKVLDSIVPGLLAGYIYSALIDSFCSEQNARLSAMDSANQNAGKLIDNLSLQYNHIRQGSITQEITEVSSGARGMKRNRGSRN